MLAIVVSIYSGNIFTSFVVFSGLYTSIPHSVLVFYPLNRLVCPAFYFFVLFLLNPKRSFKWYDILHVIPALYVFYTTLPFYTLPFFEKTLLIEELWFGHRYGVESFRIRDLIRGVLMSEPKLIYIIISIFLLKKAGSTYKQYSSNTFIDFIDWLRRFTNFYLCFLLATIATGFIASMFGISASKTEAVTHLATTFFIHYIVFIAIKQPEKLFYVFDTSKLRFDKEKQTDQIDASITSLLLLMENEKPYLDPDLKVHNLATMLHTTPHSISKLINQEKEVNFYTFINEYRVNEFKKRANSNLYSHLTLLGIALSVGFNSKSSFNRIFKKQTGMTPSEYMKSKKVSSSNIGTSVE
ncbi:helix-turn-helix domain-containing protein [Aquimarina pacifica]|uniref:helix-turn-helix domain-containing protein n=1 Tax=Aquimarina pacifica TaxID=1296415 RepID=UPI00137879A5|nr:helix-turn-helix domain-containing protein [Aquimarina pacifica]